VSPSFRHFVVTSVGLAALALPAAAQRRATGLPGAQGAPVSRLPPRPAGVIDGAVSDSMLAPLPMAEVSVLRTPLRIFTNPQGRFRITDVAAGQYILIVRRIGFQPISQVIEVGEKDTLHVSYELSRLPKNLLDTVRVIAERTTQDLRDFEQRRLRGVGEFLTREQIVRRGSLELVDLMRGFRSISIAEDPSKGGGLPEQIAYNKRDYGNFLTKGPGACPMEVVVDGVNMPSGFDLNLGPLVSQIAGIEVYGGPSTAPSQFQGMDRRCGLILIWTRVGK
jgi:hypothetical protein